MKDDHKRRLHDRGKELYLELLNLPAVFSGELTPRTVQEALTNMDAFKTRFEEWFRVSHYALTLELRSLAQNTMKGQLR